MGTKLMMSGLAVVTALGLGLAATLTPDRSAGPEPSMVVEANDSPELVNVAVNTPSLSTCFSRILAVGASGPCVKSLQESLLALPGWKDAFRADGLYGARTRLAVVYYQGWAGLAQDGQAGPITLKNLDRDANRPVPAGRPATLPRMPDKDAVFSRNANNLSKRVSLTTLDVYYTQGTTRWFNDKLGDVSTDAAIGAASIAACTSAGLVTGFAGGLTCDLLFYAEGLNIKRASQEAARSGGCFKLTVRNIGMGAVQTTYSADHSHNCIP
ncbi:peptidoglycan-binding protein [Dactylosporangium vinaceum]|uniref:Peptidoglycan-binding protein n=1 Tax=Dactylosporangium vinaceum TaxID=53362 RepID=A0ABV5M5G4_9ACTN|nr:peptidoglycan-binding domain-containing protein [Dactylosporangium vinaceum]UAB95550.1 peptidoglycan-binding protein [Dactylosporangium vinaceum]